MPPYPNRSRALRNAHRRRAAYLRTMTARYTHVPQRYVLGPLEDELDMDLSAFQGMTAALLRPHHELQALIAARARARFRRLEPVFHRLYLNAQVTTLDT